MSNGVKKYVIGAVVLCFASMASATDQERYANTPVPKSMTQEIDFSVTFLLQQAAETSGYEFVPPKDKAADLPRVKLTDLSESDFKEVSTHDVLINVGFAVSPDYHLIVDVPNELIILERSENRDTE